MIRCSGAAERACVTMGEGPLYGLGGGVGPGGCRALTHVGRGGAEPLAQILRGDQDADTDLERRDLLCLAGAAYRALVEVKECRHFGDAPGRVLAVAEVVEVHVDLKPASASV